MAAAGIAPAAAQQIKCVSKTAPKINITPTKSRVKYDFTKTKADLNSFNIDTISPFGPQHKTNVSGLMSGSIQVSQQIGFMNETYEQLGQGCIYIRSIDVKLHIDPTVFIAKEHPPGTCMHNAVMAHEKKHVREDQLIVNKYANIIGRNLGAFLDTQGAALGPFNLEKIPKVQENIQNSLTAVLKKYNDIMNMERKERQQAIDSLEEYEDLGRQCPDKVSQK
jgi:hypothetical protein